MTRVFGGLGLLCWLAVVQPMAAAAQEQVESTGAEVPARAADVEPWAVAVFNRQGTTAIVGEHHIESDRRYSGDVAVLDGPLVVEGVIEGTLVAINADVRLLDGAVVGGDVVVLGGMLEDAVGARVGGTMRRHSAPVSVRLDGTELTLLEPSPRPRRERSRWADRSRASILLGLGGTYNRVEGLPLRLGARFEWRRGVTSTRLRAWGVFRTAGDFKANSEDIGYVIDGRVAVGRDRVVAVGARYYDLVVPTQDWPLALNEVGWASFFWHRDYRDYYLQNGIEAFVELQPVDDLVLATSVRWVDEVSIAARDPWTPFRNSEEWRPNPAIDAGSFTIVKTSLEYDTRPSRRAIRSGVFARLEWEHGIGSSVVPQVLPPSIRPAVPTDDYVYDRLSADARLYQRVGGSGQVRLRGFWAGSIGRDPLPIQRRFSLGGPDPMNGYAFRAFSCNTLADPALTGLCDQVLLFQGEFRGGLDFDWFSSDFRSLDVPTGDDDDWGIPEWMRFRGPTLVLMANAGTGWLDDQPVGALHVDLGAGIELGGVGLYVAKALQEGEPVRVTLRIERRF
jgi:hypothetical protein